MKQPDLGKKITELRKAKGWTQEELVEKCNISVRTIQRIETGEVTPRSFTVKTILAALDYDFSRISSTEDAPLPESNWLKRFFYLDADPDNSSALIKGLNVAAVFGILYFAIGFLEAAVEYGRFTKHELLFGVPVYVAIKISMLVSYILFIRAFIMLGVLTDNYLMKSVVLISISIYTLLVGYDIATVFYDAVEREFVLMGFAFTYGVIGIIFGVSLRTLESSVGRIAEIAGFSEIVAGCFFLTMFLAFIAEFIMVPALLAEIIIIFKAIELIRRNQFSSKPL